MEGAPRKRRGMPRKKTRLTVRKQRKASTFTENEGEQDWDSASKFKKIVISDDDNEEFVFSVGDLVSILPPITSKKSDGLALPTNDMWWAIIREIRQKNGDIDEVWAKVQWFYSGKDVKDVVKSFRSEEMGTYERCFSDHCDVVHTSTLDEVLEIRRYNPFDIEGPEIRAEQNWYRYDFEKDARTLSPKPRSTTQTCHGPCPSPSYAPPDSEKAKIIGDDIARVYEEIRAIVVRLLHLATAPESLQSGTQKRKKYIKSLEPLTSSASPSPAPNASGNRSGRSRGKGRTNPTSVSPPTQLPTQRSTIPTLLDALRASHERFIALEGSLIMHICPRKRCQGRRGRAYHRACCTGTTNNNHGRETAEAVEDREEEEEIGADDAAIWQNRWRRMSKQEQSAIIRTITLLSSEEDLTFPVIGGTNGQHKGKEKAVNSSPHRTPRRKTRSTRVDDDGDEEEQSPEELDTLLPTPTSPKRKRLSRNTHPSSKPPSSSTKRRRRLHTDGDSDLDVGSSTLNTADEKDTSHIPQIMHTLSLLPPALVFLASQPLVKGGVSVSLPSSGGDNDNNDWVGDENDLEKQGLPSDLFFGTSFPRQLGRTDAEEPEAESSTVPPPQSQELVIGIPDTITGNAPVVLRARKRVREMLEWMSSSHTRREGKNGAPMDLDDESESEMEPDLAEGEEAQTQERRNPWVNWVDDVPKGWEEYVVEKQGRTWLFEYSRSKDKLAENREDAGADEDADGDEDIEMASPTRPSSSSRSGFPSRRREKGARTRTRSQSPTKRRTKPTSTNDPAHSSSISTSLAKASVIASIKNILCSEMSVLCPSCGQPI